MGRQSDTVHCLPKWNASTNSLFRSQESGTMPKLPFSQSIWKRRKLKRSALLMIYFRA